MAEREIESHVAERIAWVESELEAVVADRPSGLDLYQMLRYHLGWLGEDLSPVPLAERRRFGGKKLRGPLCVLACEAVGGDGRAAACGGAAVELIHNFSLIHDDVEDQDAERRHRPTVWVRWGVSHAVNAGSNMQALVNCAGLRLRAAGVAPDRVLDALDCLTRAMLAMTQGQFLDIQFQDAWDTGIEDYLEMSAGKTGALVEAATRLGALVGTDRADSIEALARFGRSFGMAFQARDDYLGIWGERDTTGKPVGGDILKGKRSLPVVCALSRSPSPELRRALETRNVAVATEILEASGARTFVEETVAQFTADALRELDRPELQPMPVRALRYLAEEALGRVT